MSLAVLPVPIHDYSDERTTVYRMTLKNGTVFTLEDDGSVVARTDGPRGWNYSGKWIVTGIKRRHHSLDVITLAQAAAGADIGHGVVCDIDHGSHRQWSHPRGRQVRSIVQVAA